MPLPIGAALRLQQATDKTRPSPYATRLSEAAKDDVRAVLAENEAMRHTIVAVRTLAEKWGGEPTTIDRFLANAILAIVVEPAPRVDPSPRHDSARCAPAGGGCACESS